MYQKVVAACLRCDPIPACQREDDQLEPPWEVIDRILRERDEARGQRDRLAELHNKNAIHFNELLELCGTLRKVSRAASVLIASKGRHNTMLAYNGLRDALQSLTPDEKP
jgi:hypothetical protein